MRRARLTAALLMLSFVLLFATQAFGLASSAENPTKSPNNPTSGDLVDSPKKWDGQTITFTGEAITEAQERGAYSWIHLNDDAYYLKNVEEGAHLGGYNSGQAVWIPTELAHKIGMFGDYTHEGDVVRVTGTFNAACGQHGGDMDIHATGLEVVTPGHVVHEPVKFVKLAIALLMLAIAAALWISHRRLEHLETFGPMGAKAK